MPKRRMATHDFSSETRDLALRAACLCDKLAYQADVRALQAMRAYTLGNDRGWEDRVGWRAEADRLRALRSEFMAIATGR